MYRRIAYFIYIVLILNCFINAQPGTLQFDGRIEGNVFDKHSKTPLEYANIVVFTISDSSQVNGAVTNPNGHFSININRPGVYYIRIGFIGYKDIYIDSLRLNRNTKTISFNEILLEPQAYNLKEVVVQGEGAPITYHIDKKVINVSQQFTNLSGSAVDILENVPSVSVDIEGNVSLRGSGSFQVLVDGRPTILDASEALQQIPASSIENIEIITNPSAKYNPEGTAGIINVLLKKNTLAGMSGIAEANVGLNNKYGGETILDFKMDGYELNFGVDYNKRSFEMNSISENRSDYQGISTYLNSKGTGARNRTSFGIRGSININLDDNNNLLFGVRYGDRDGKMNNSSFYTKSVSNTGSIQNYLNSSSRNRGGNFYELNMNYLHKFNEAGHELSSEIGYEYSNGNEGNTTTLAENGIITYGQKSTEDGPDNELRVKMDYVLPLNDESKFEAGYQTEIELTEESNNVFDYDTTSGDYIFKDQFSNRTKYDDIVHSIYSLYSGTLSNFKYQFGLRGENTNRKIKLLKNGESFTINEIDFFPSFHMSAKLSENNQLMTSYTRRIQRPHGWELEPFDTWMDAYNLRRGNPALKPEYIDSYELGFQLLMGKSLFSVETYYRVNNNKIEHIRSVYSPDVNLTTTQNVGKSYSLGAETMVNFDPLSDWNVNLMGDFYNYKIEGNYFDQDFSKKSFSWSMRFNNSIKLSSTTQVQINGMYNSPVVTSQEERKAFFSANAAVKQDLFERQLTLTLQVRDLIRTSKHESITQTASLYQYSSFEPEAPMVMLNIRFNFNNYKNREKRENEERMDTMEEEF
ncbi:MAG: TonB-dependent receptor [Ignavibacteriaceae bacterium]|nr:TonB-dependent receptor [Ignavibacteriaceae bacterium]